MTIYINCLKISQTLTYTQSFFFIPPPPPTYEMIPPLSSKSLSYRLLHNPISLKKNFLFLKESNQILFQHDIAEFSNTVDPKS